MNESDLSRQLDNLQAWASEHGGALAFRAVDDDPDGVEPALIRLYENADGFRLDIGVLNSGPYTRAYFITHEDWQTLLDNPLDLDELCEGEES